MKLTKKEQQWADKVEKLLSNLPSERIGLFTIGDECLMIYDKTKESEFDDDFCCGVSRSDSLLGYINCSTNIVSAAG